MDPPGISGRANQTAEMTTDLERVPPRETTALVTTNPRVHGLDASGPMLQRFYSTRPAAHGAPNPPIPRIRIPHRPTQARIGWDLNPIDANSYRHHLNNHVRTTDGHLRRTNADSLNNHLTNRIREMDADVRRTAADSWNNNPNNPVHTTDGHLRRIEVDTPDNHPTNHVRTTDEINTGASGASSARAETFVESLPVPSLTSLPEDSRGCPICFEQYQSLQDSDRPVRLSCNHVLGKDCLLSWLTSSMTNNHTCPMCRADLFERVDVSPKERLRALLGELDAQNQMMEAEPPRLWRIGNRYRRDAEYYRTVERLRRLVQQNTEAIALLQIMRHDRARRTRRSGLEESREGAEGNEGNSERP